MKKTYPAALLVAALSCVAACHRQAPVAATLDVQPRSLTLAYPQLTTLHMTWTPAAGGGGETPSEPLVFLHLLDAKGGVLRTFDHVFPQHWPEAATPVSYDAKLYQSAMAPPLDPGKYRLSVGLYDHNGKRWALDGVGKPIGRYEYQAAEIVVPPQPAGPQLSFSAAWLALEAGSDKQVLARHQLSDQPGEIEVNAIPGPGALWLSFQIPPGDGASEKLVAHDAASNTPAAVVRSSCGAVETGISGPGAHEVEMPIDGPGAGGVCRITVIPNFHIVSTDQAKTFSLALQVAAWIPGGAPAGMPTGSGGPTPPPGAAAPASPPAPGGTGR